MITPKFGVAVLDEPVILTVLGPVTNDSNLVIEIVEATWAVLGVVDARSSVIIPNRVI